MQQSLSDSSPLPQNNSKHRDARALNLIWWFVVAACYGVIALAFAAHISARFIWDDSYMFVRYADNLIASGKLAWNPGGEPTFGLTSPLFLLIIVPIRLFLPTSPALVVWLSSQVSGFVFFVLLFWLIERHTPGDWLVRQAVLVLVLFSLASSMDTLSIHLSDGMDTMFALAYITAYFLIIKWHARAQSRASVMWSGVWGGLAFWARPDLMIFTVLIPVSVLLFDTDRKAKRNTLAILGITILLTLGAMGLASWYFGSSLPLPFNAKVLRLYGDTIYLKYTNVSLQMLSAYLQAYWYLLVIIGINLILNFKTAWRATASSDKGMFVASILFIVYYALFVLQIMWWGARFYYPTFPAILFLATQSLVSLIQHPPTLAKVMMSNLRSPVLRISSVILIALLVPTAISQARIARADLSRGFLGQFSMAKFHEMNWYGFLWFRLAEFSALPDDLVIAATEVGNPAAMNPRKSIVDLAGLNTIDFARPPFSADLLFEKYNPDLIYMPHPDYAEMNRAITSAAYFKEHYDYIEASSIGTLLSVAVRRDSKYYPAMRQIVEKGREIETR